MTVKNITDTALKWVVGITVPALFIVLSMLTSITSTVEARASDLEVLKVRVESLEESVRDINGAVDRILGATQDMRVQQTSFQTELRIKISDVQRDLSELRSGRLRRRNSN